MSIFDHVNWKRPSNKKKVVLIGGAGWPNYGDELIVDAWKDFLMRNDVADEIYFYEGTEKQAKALHGRGSGKTKIIFRDDIERLSGAVKGLDFWGQVKRGYDFIENDGINRYNHIDFSVFKEASCVHMHGGGYLNDLWPERGFYLGFVAALNKHYGVKIAATGIGFGPVKEVPDSLRDVLREVFSRFSIFELRDIDYFRSLRKDFNLPSIVYGLDDCFLKDINEIIKPGGGIRKRLFLSFIDYNVRKFPESFWNDLRLKSKEFDEVVFFESSPEQDKNVVEFLNKEIGIASVQTVEDSINKGVLVSEEDEVICSRFHVHYIFARYGIKGYYSQDSSYYDVKHQSIIDRGSDFYFSDFASPLDDMKNNGPSLLSRSDELLRKQKINIAESIYML